MIRQRSIIGGLHPHTVKTCLGQQCEFQKILNHRGIVGLDAIGALAHLQLGRTFVLAGDNTKAKTAYQDFLTLWNEADAEIPILKQAKAEYAKL